MHPLRLYFRYMRIHFLGGLQYKGWPLQILHVLFTVATDPLDVLVLLASFGAVGDWPATRILMCYGLAVGCYGLAELLARGFDYFPFLIKQGEFDRILLRPRSTFLQTMMLRFHIHRLARASGGLILMAYCLAAEGIRLSLGKALLLLAAIVSGVLIYTAVFLFTCAVAFYTVQFMDWMYIFTNGSYQVAKVPPAFLPTWLRRSFTLLMPMLLFCYYPLSAICAWGDPLWLGCLALPGASAFFALNLALWNLGARRYKSAGS